jgi:hypothetical protein
MNSIFLFIFFLLCSRQTFGQEQAVVKFAETKHYVLITLKTSESLNPGVQGKFLIQLVVLMNNGPDVRI